MQRGGYPPQQQQQQQAVPAAGPAVDDDWGTVEQLLKRESEEDASLQVGGTQCSPVHLQDAALYMIMPCCCFCFKTFNMGVW
jgi:hypothetical protein